jgi:hypothetical protein
METINKKEFRTLTKTEQVILLFREGREVSERFDEGFDIHLYKLSDLYIELWYPSNAKKIVKVKIINPDKVKKDYSNL